MKALARLALRLLTGISTVFIAACYGVRSADLNPQRPGRVVDSQSGIRIPGILVSCFNGGRVVDQDVTDDHGEFLMPLECAEYGAEDVDGTVNGAYLPKTATYPGGTTDPVVIELDPAPQG